MKSGPNVQSPLQGNMEVTNEVPASVPLDAATEATEPAPPDITQLCRETFAKTADYLNGELTCK